MHLLTKDQQCFLVYLLVLPPPIPKATQIQCDEGDSRLALTIAIAKYHMAEPNPKISVLSRRYPITHSTFKRYTGEFMMNGSQYQQSRLSRQQKWKKTTKNNDPFGTTLCFHKENSLKSLFCSPPCVKRPKSFLQIKGNIGIPNDRANHFPIRIAWEGQSPLVDKTDRYQWELSICRKVWFILCKQG